MAITKHSDQRVAVFIDTQNLYHTAKNLYHAKINFANVLKEAVAGRQLIRARAYVVNTESGEETAFFEALHKLGIEVRTKDLQIFGDGSKKADWDVGLAVDAIAAAPKLDAVILATGDGDFCPLVEYLRMNEGCQVEVISFGRSTSAKLKETTDEFIDMDKDPSKYLITYKGWGNGRQIPRKKPFTKPRPPVGRDSERATAPSTTQHIPAPFSHKEKGEVE